MGRAGKALQNVLTTYGISQNRLAVALDVRRSVVYRWFHERTDPTAETVATIVTGLNEINPEAAKEFIDLYLGSILNDTAESPVADTNPSSSSLHPPPQTSST
ncbi:MAG: helix-turn-helix transcriptional regulator [Cyanobacteria bacterium P01_C01_bin.89]